MCIISAVLKNKGAHKVKNSNWIEIFIKFSFRFKNQIIEKGRFDSGFLGV